MLDFKRSSEAQRRQSLKRHHELYLKLLEHRRVNASDAIEDSWEGLEAVLPDLSRSKFIEQCEKHATILF